MFIALSNFYLILSIYISIYHWHVASSTIYPPQHSCLEYECPQSKKGMLLKKAEQQNIVIFTLDKGACPAYAVHLYCEGMVYTTIH